MNYSGYLNQNSTILIVDDMEENLKLLSNTLAMAGYRVRPARNGHIALQYARRRPPDLVLLDICMPEMGGLEVCRRMKADARTADIPIIFISALEDIGDKIEAFESGGVDYITKPFQEKEILSRVKTHLSLYTMHQHLETLVAQRTRELENTNRALRLISHSNQQLVHIDSEKSLMQAFCRSLIDIGDYPFCWVGTPDYTREGVLTVVECAAAKGQELAWLAELEIRCDTGPTARALGSNRCLVINDLENGTPAHPWQSGAVEQGLAACLSLPLSVDGAAYGAWTTYASTTGFFGSGEVELLKELADNLALGLHMVRERARRQEAELALKNSEKRYRSLFESAGDAIFILEAEGDGAGRIAAANQEAARMHGYPVEALIGKSICILDTPEAARDVPSKIRRMLAGERIHTQLDHVCRDGRIFPVDVSAGALEIGSQKYILALYRDVSEREKNKAALKDHLAYQSVLAGLRALTPASSDDEIITTFLEQTLLHYGFKMAWYGSFAKGCITPLILAGEAAPPLNKTVLDLNAPDAPDGRHAVSRAVQTCRAFGYADLNAAGASSGRCDQALSRRYGSNLAFPIRVDNRVEGGVTFYAGAPNGFPADRAERLQLLADELGRTLQEYRARRKMKRELERLATVVEQSTEAVMITDADGMIRYVNPSFERITGYSRDEVTGQNAGVLKSGQHADGFYKELWRTIKSGDVWQGRLINKRKDGRLYHEDTIISPIFDSRNRVTGYMSVKRDITEQLKLESRLRQTQKMEALGTLAGGIAHDFNNILYPIIGYAELILSSLDISQPNHRRINEILNCAKHANQLVGQISAFSRRSKPELRPLKLQPIIEEVLKPFRDFLPPNMDLIMELDIACGFVMADPAHVRQVVLNLVTNASHAMESTGGQLQVDLHPVRLTKKMWQTWQSHPVRPGDYACLRVIDEGTGINKAVMDKLFDPYFSTKEKGKGSGLGLAVVHGIVIGYGGGIRVHSEEGHGARFEIYLPISAGQTDSGEVQDMVPDLPKGHEHIMAVDDNPHNLNLIEDSLQDLGYRVTKYTGAQEALDDFQADPDRFDMVVTDYVMPQLSGARLARALLKLKPRLPIILCTGHSEQLSGEEALAMGIQQYLNKPVSRHELAQAVRRVLDRNGTNQDKNEG